MNETTDLNIQKKNSNKSYKIFLKHLLLIMEKRISCSPDFSLGICVSIPSVMAGMETPSLTHFHLRACSATGEFTVYSHRAVWLVDEKVCIPESWGIKVKLVGH